MSYKNFEEALEKLPKCDGYFIKENLSVNIVNEAEKKLNIEFSKQLKYFLRMFKYVSFYGNEFYGIIKEDFTGGYTPQIVVATIEDRKRTNMPQEYLHLWDAGDGAIGVLDYSQLNEESEPPVLLIDYRGEEQGWIVLEKLADDLGDFLLQLVEKQLATQ